MELNADFPRRAVVHAARLPWVPSPMAGVERRMLNRSAMRGLGPRLSSAMHRRAAVRHGTSILVVLRKTADSPPDGRRADPADCHRSGRAARLG
jgi:hypothetical protein